MPFLIALAEILEGGSLILAGIGIVMILRSSWYAGLLLFGVSALLFVVARSLVRRHVALHRCRECGEILEGRPPACPRCGPMP